MRLASLSLRLAIWVGILGLLQAAAVLTFSYLTLATELDSKQRAVLRDKAEHARTLVSGLADGPALRANAPHFVELVSGHSELHLMVARPGATEPWLDFSPQARESHLRFKRNAWGSDAFLEWQSRTGERPMLSLATAAKTRSGEPYEIVLTADRSEDRRLLAHLLITSASAAPFVLALVGVCALVFVKLGLRPLNRLSSAAAHISAHDLSTRIDATALPKELQSLGFAFNAMLDRLDEGVRRLSEFSSDLAHELRTPLATLLGRTQVALSQPRSSAELVDVLEGNVEELQRLSRLVSDMLFLARADDARASLDCVELDFSDEARQLAEFLELLALERDMEIDVSGHAVVTADRQQVRRAITNLVSNALRHGTPGSTVRVSGYVDGDTGCIDVVNDGPPIPPEHQVRLFDRFYRIDGSRTRDSGGSGLGLALVRAIMTLHEGTVRLHSDRATGTRFTLCFPRHAEPGRRGRPAAVNDENLTAAAAR